MRYFTLSPCGTAPSRAAHKPAQRLFGMFLSILLLPGTALGVSNSGADLGGSVSGPVIGANIIVRDGTGRQLLSTISNDAANYAVSLPSDAAFPVTITATGGLDIVSGTAPGFTMLSVTTNAKTLTLNINPFSTLIVKTTQAMQGGLTDKNLQQAEQHILQQLGFGLDTAQVPQPMTTAVTGQNITHLLNASQAFAETIRRTYAVLQQSGTTISENQLIDALAADMADGQLDGIGAKNTRPLFSATTIVVSGQVLLEALTENLYVNGVWANDLLNNAMLVSTPNTTETTAGGFISAEMLNQAILATHAAQSIAPSNALSTIAMALGRIPPNAKTENIENLLPAYASDAFDSAIAQISALTHAELAATGIFDLFTSTEKLAVEATHASSYDARRGRVPDNAIDGDLQSKWTTLTMPQQISLDLGNIQLVNKTRMQFYGGNRGRDFSYTILTSLDNVNWSVAAHSDELNLSPAWTEISFAPVRARYVRIALNSTNRFDYANVYEIEVYKSNKPLLDFSATELLIDYNATTSLQWDAINASTCHASGAWAGRYDIAGSEHVGPLTADSTFTLTCLTEEGISTNQSITVGVRSPKLTEKLEISRAYASGYDARRGRVPDNVIDGDLQSKWTTLTMPQQISLDLGNIQLVNKTRMQFYGGNRGRDFSYTILTSLDNVNWSVAAHSDELNLSPAWTELSFAPVRARYVRIALNSTNRFDYANIYEVEVYGDSNDHVVAPSTRKIKLSWNANADSVQGYIVYHSPTANTAFQKYISVDLEMNNVNPDAPMIELDPVAELGYQPGDPICFKVRAYDSDGISGWPLPVCGNI